VDWDVEKFNIVLLAKWKLMDENRESYSVRSTYKVLHNNSIWKNFDLFKTMWNLKVLPSS